MKAAAPHGSMGERRHILTVHADGMEARLQAGRLSVPAQAASAWSWSTPARSSPADGAHVALTTEARDLLALRSDPGRAELRWSDPSIIGAQTPASLIGDALLRAVAGPGRPHIGRELGRLRQNTDMVRRARSRPEVARRAGVRAGLDLQSTSPLSNRRQPSSPRRPRGVRAGPSGRLPPPPDLVQERHFSLARHRCVDDDGSAGEHDGVWLASGGMSGHSGA